ncbi:hypothetical protein LTR17_004763 [Elasticomyces elasticus]|uniref:NADH-ubiquinone oxidoreductase 213 kDa subunit n=1 Tax=Elasticomyces elasticus TaxID=574655 RepID=A0AAN7WBW7_9PEZI|nr:hypothetical protein LTR27_010840 [Elasticomyces elasticus]KAK4960107.1 hypothetical protein LTR10_002998 [Elasticomyces elasticus]KAK4967664.1 hypothetical protein LTR42_009989 [Elasticomyces elasticus]KAK5686294.1 hypothetical protein LTS10_002410 [Elasticomyces elasticus]KAK5689376.1 hypothetical protein LTR17_026293 [Elasticomyces elasticus]
MADHQPDQDQVEELYQPKDSISAAIKATGVTATAGAFISTIQNTLTRHNAGAWGAVTRFGSTTALFAAMGGTYEFSKNAAANLREKDDAYNPAIGGFFAGTMMGLRFRSPPLIIGYGTGLAALLFAFSFTGGRLNGYERDPTVDEVSRKEYMRKNRRRPVEQTVNELGESARVNAPGYEERRAQRIKEAYGIDVPMHSAAAS